MPSDTGPVTLADGGTGPATRPPSEGPAGRTPGACLDEFECPGDGGTDATLPASPGLGSGGDQPAVHPPPEIDDAGMLPGRAPDAGVQAPKPPTTRPRDPFLIQLDGTFRGACALTRSGHIHCVQDFVSDVPEPRTFEANADERGGYIKVATGHYATCALHAEGDIRCFGTGQAAEPPTATDFVDLDVEGNHACGLHRSGEIECWGNPGGGEVAGPALDEQGDFTRVFVGMGATCGLRSDGSLRCWGIPEVWQPVFDGLPAPLPPGDIAQLSVTRQSLCARSRSGEVACWGAKYDDTPLNAPTGVYEDISDIGFHAICGVLKGGDLRCTQNDSYLWLPLLTAPATLHDVPYIQVAVGDNSLYALRADGTLQVWENR